MEDKSQIQYQEVVLKYDKRRYDGGSEVELIEYLEAQNAVAQLNNPELRQYELKELQQQAAAASAAKSRWQKIAEALAIGPMELAVGTVGIFTSLLAIATFRWFNNHTMADQSKQVLRDCWKTLGQGCIHLATGPVKAIKILLTRTQK
ncbi:MAG: hypothetical protein KTR14_11480 [Vampirovibrio sp.]|nr:hypothetical protein [Vampirovibrio sp.]